MSVRGQQPPGGAHHPKVRRGTADLARPGRRGRRGSSSRGRRRSCRCPKQWTGWSTTTGAAAGSIPTGMRTAAPSSRTSACWCASRSTRRARPTPASPSHPSQARRDGVLKRHLFDWHEEGVPMQIAVVGPADLPELLPLMRAYCDFYQVAPEDQALLELSQVLLADPQREGLQLLARDGAGRAVGFATLYWTWQTLAAARVGVMNDLYVAAEARGIGLADRLIAACLERC